MAALYILWAVFAWLLLLPEIGTVYMFLHKQIEKVFPKYNVEIKQIVAAIFIVLCLLIHFLPKQDVSVSNTKPLPKPTTFLKNKNGKTVAQQEISTISAEEMNRIADSIFALKGKYKTSALITVKGGVTVKGSTGAFVDTNKPKPIDTSVIVSIPTLKDSIFEAYKAGLYVHIDSVILPGRVSVDSSKNMYKRETVLLTGIRLDSLHLPNKQDIRITQEKGLFKNKPAVVQIMNSNDYFSTTNIESLTVPSRPTWWQRTGKPIAAALLTAIILRK